MRRRPVAVALLAAAACTPCDAEVEATVYESATPTESLMLDVRWFDEWVRSWIAFGKNAEESEESTGFLEEPRRACRMPDDGEKVTALDGVRVSWDPEDLHDDVLFETSVNDGYEWGLSLPIVDGEARASLIGSTADGAERVLGTSEAFWTGPLPACRVEGPLPAGGDFAVGTSLHLRVRGSPCDPTAYDAFVQTPDGLEPTDADLSDGSVDLVIGDWESATIVLEPNATAPEGTQGTFGPWFTTGPAGAGRCGPLGAPFRADDPSAPPPFKAGQRLEVEVVDPVACTAFLDAGGVAAAPLLRGADGSGAAIAVRLAPGATTYAFDVPIAPAGDYVLALDQGGASLESPAFGVAEPDPLPCVLPGPVGGSTLLAGEAHGVPIGNADTCDLAAFASASLCLDAGLPSPPPCTTLEDAAALADGVIDFTIPLTTDPSDDARIVLVASAGDDVRSPSFRVDFAPCGLTALAGGSRLPIGDTISLPIDDGDRCDPDRRYDGAFLRSVDDPSGFAPVALDDDLSDGTVDFDVPDAPDGAYTVGLGTLAADALTSDAIRIGPIGTGGGDTCAIQVDAPPAGAEVDAGATIAVAWWSDCGIPLDVVLMKGPFPIADPVTVATDEPDDGSATVTIPSGTTGGTDYRLCVQTPDGASVDCSAPFEVVEPCVASSTLTWTPIGSTTATPLAQITPTMNGGLVALQIQQTGVSAPVWGGAIYAVGVSSGQPLTQATGALLPDAPGESLWSSDDNATYPPQAMSTSVTGTVTTWTFDDRLVITGLSAAVTSGNASYRGTLAGSFTVCFP